MADDRADLPGTYRVFAYAVAERADLYVDVVDALVAAKERFRLQLRPGEVARELAGLGRLTDEGEVRSALEALADWGNVARFYDSAAPETLAEFYAKRFLYQLTPEGLAAHGGVQAVRRTGLDAGGRLSAVLLPGTVEKLQAVRAEAGEAAPDGARLYTLLVDLFNAFAELADNAGRYMSDLAVETAEVSGDSARFVAYKRAVFAYLNTFVARFTEVVPGIVDLVTTLDDDMPRLLGLAAAHDTAPSAAGDDTGPLAAFERRWEGIRLWFVPQGEHPAVAESLRVAMLDALNRILVAVTRLNERQLRRASREADFTTLAQWFAAVDGDDAHHLWDATFGAFPARHFTDPAGDEESERRRSFWEAEPAALAPRLRAAGVRASPGRPGPVSDYSAVKERRVAALRAARARAVEAVSRLAARTPCRLSELGAIDNEEFDQLLAFLAAALASRPTADGQRRALTPFARVSLGPPAGDPVVTGEAAGTRAGGAVGNPRLAAGDAPAAAISTPGGVFHAPDFLLDVAMLGGAADVNDQVDRGRAVGDGGGR